MGIIITGTDTEVGKTFFSALLVRALRERGVDAVGYKPICCGERTDAEELVLASDGAEPIEVLNPVWYRAPVTPAVAAELEGQPVALDSLLEHAREIAERHRVVVLEGVGGWEVPLSQTETFADLAEALGWPVVLVAANRLGVLNHALLSKQAIADRGLTLAALVLNHLVEERDVAMVTNRAVLAARFGEIPLWELMRDQDWLEDDLVAAVQERVF